MLEDLRHKEGVIAKIEREGIDGYLEFLVIALNQHWASVYMVESLRGKFEQSLDEEEEHRKRVQSIQGILRVIDEDWLIRRRFRRRWDGPYRLRYLAILIVLGALGIVMHVLMYSKLQQPHLTGILDMTEVRRVGWGFLGAVLLLLSFMELFVFRPMTRRIDLDVKALKLLQGEIEMISEREQRKLGRELHDGLGQQLTGIALQCEALATRLKENGLPEAEDALRVAGIANESVKDVRRITHGLSPVCLETKGLIAVLEELVVFAKGATGLSCEIKCDGCFSVVDKSVAINLYRITQEALNNAVKHVTGQSKPATSWHWRSRSPWQLPSSKNWPS